MNKIIVSQVNLMA